MKLNRIFAIALAALTMTACSDDDDTQYNTASDVTVNMETATMEIPEDNSGMINVPIKVSGKANGMIKVTVELQKTGNNPAESDVHYIATSDYVYIPEGQDVGNFEFHATGDDEINADRQFAIKIVSVEGAKIGSETTTLVTLVDDDHLIPNALNRLKGQWITSITKGQYLVKIEALPENDPKHNKQIKISGFGGDPELSFLCNFKVNAITERVSLTITCPQLMQSNADFGDGDIFDIVAIPIIDGYIEMEGSISATSDVNVTSFRFDGGLAAAAYTPGELSSDSYHGYLFYGLPFTLTKYQ